MCEVCQKAPAKEHDIMCPDCAHSFGVLRELLRDHPELARDDFERLRQLFDWRMKKILAIGR